MIVINILKHVSRAFHDPFQCLDLFEAQKWHVIETLDLLDEMH